MRHNALLIPQVAVSEFRACNKFTLQDRTVKLTWKR